MNSTNILSMLSRKKGHEGDNVCGLLVLLWESMF